jgi:hypothetical protein
MSELNSSDGIVVKCDYCQRPAKLVSGLVVYPHRRDLADKMFYLCVPCDAYVGCHMGTTFPFGRLANAELRKAKTAAHAAFDPIWQYRLSVKRKTDKSYTKGHARGGRYKKLGELMGIPGENCHIGMFDVEQCKKAVEICRSGAMENDL